MRTFRVYDLNRNLISKTAKPGVTRPDWSYDYDDLDQLISVSRNGLEVERYRYDAFGRRSVIETANDNAVFERTALVNDGSDRTIDLVQDGAGATQIQNRYTHGGQVDEPLSLEVFAPDGSLDQSYTYHADHLGSIRFVTDSVGTIVNAYEYDSYGRPNFELEQVSQPFRYTGREWDQATELYHYRARAYDPETGKFLQEDPIGFLSGDLNIYRYTGSNPINFVDPSGYSRTISPGLGFRAGGTSSAESAAVMSIATASTTSIAMVGCELTATFTGIASLFDVAGPAHYEGMERTGLCVKQAVTSPIPDGVIGPFLPGLEGVHGNSKRSNNSTWVYYLTNAKGIYKIGQTSFPDKRYPQAYLRANGLTMVKIMRYDSKAPALLHEKLELGVYFYQNGKLPPGNKGFR